MNAAERRKLQRSLKVLTQEGLVAPNIPDFEEQKRLTIRLLRRRVKSMDVSADFFLAAHRPGHKWDSEQSRQFFGRIMEGRRGLTRKINVLVGHEHFEAEYDSP